MHNLRAILLVIAAMAGFTVEDILIKQMTLTLPVGEILLLIASGCVTVFWLWALLRRDPILARHNWRPKVLIRAATEGASAVSFATALALVDISVVGAVFQSMPLVVTLGAALFLGESVGWRRWAAITVGFLGVVTIIRPGLTGFEPNVLWVLITVVMVATRDLMTRVMDAAVPSTVVSLQAFLMVIPAGFFKLWLSGESLIVPSATDMAMVAGAIVCAVSAYSCIVIGMRLGDASAVTPFRYTRLIFTMIGGMLIFGERPDLLTYVGSALIIASGLYAFLRERKLARLHRENLMADLQAPGI